MPVLQLRLPATYTIQKSLKCATDSSSSLAKGFTHGPLSLLPQWRAFHNYPPYFVAHLFAILLVMDTIFFNCSCTQVLVLQRKYKHMIIIVVICYQNKTTSSQSPMIMLILWAKSKYQCQVYIQGILLNKSIFILFLVIIY